MRRRVVVRGRVQGVGFRASCAARAREAGVAGWAANRSDGSVEAVLVGPAAAVDAVIAWCRQGPRFARVTGVEVSDPPPGTDPLPIGFAVR